MNRILLLFALLFVLASMVGEPVQCASDATAAKSEAAPKAAVPAPPQAAQQSIQDYRLDRLEKRLDALPAELQAQLGDDLQRMRDWAGYVQDAVDKQLAGINNYLTAFGIVIALLGFGIGWSLYSKFKSQLEEAKQDFEKTAKDCLKELEGHRERGRVACAELTESAASVRALAKKEPDQQTTVQEKRDIFTVAADEEAPFKSRLMALALQAQEEKNWSKALHLWETLDDGDAVVCGNRGRALGNLGRYAEALAAFDKALSLDPNLAFAWNGKGASLANLQRFTEALEAYAKAIELDPGMALVWINKGSVLGNLGQHAEALKAFSKAIELDPSSARAWINKGNVLGSLGQNAEALEAFAKATELDPGMAMAWINKGNVLGNLGQNAEALAACSKAIELDPGLALAWNNKGSALMRTHQSWPKR